ncbi:MAG TPA: hypothetical protein ENJ20_05050 [Bacteroidetes bacterium]|nr:hypothetical protein [Bacteroidota bacterium]
MQNEDRKPTQLPAWLQAQQQNSWQIEMLIAGGAILFLAALPEHLVRFFYAYTVANSFGSESVMTLVGSYVLARALLIGFAINLLLRALWLAYLGINFVFPEGVDFERLGYAQKIEERLRRQPDTARRIIRLEKGCSLSYSLAIILALISVGVFLCLVLIYFVFSFVSPTLYDSVEAGYIILAVVLMAILGLFDHLFFRVFRRSKMPGWYWPVHRFFSYISLSFLYRREWLTLISNLRQWKVVGIIVVYFMVAFATASEELWSKMHLTGSFSLDLFEQREFLNVPTLLRMSSNAYDNLMEDDDFIFRASFSSDVVRSGEMPWLFVVYRKEIDEAFGRIMNETGAKKKWEFNSRKEGIENGALFSKALNRQFPVFIDSTVQENLSWFYFTHPKTKQRGFRTWLDTDSLSRGPHVLYISRQVLRADTLREQGYFNLAFWKE